LPNRRRINFFITSAKEIIYSPGLVRPSVCATADNGGCTIFKRGGRITGLEANTPTGSRAEPMVALTGEAPGKSRSRTTPQKLKSSVYLIANVASNFAHISIFRTLSHKVQKVAVLQPVIIYPRNPAIGFAQHCKLPVQRVRAEPGRRMYFEVLLELNNAPGNTNFDSLLSQLIIHRVK